MFCHKIKKYIGAYYVELGCKADAVIFTGGIGENAVKIREQICEDLDCIGLNLDKAKNKKLSAGKSGLITKEDSTLKAYVFPTNEELLIARDTVRVLKNAPRRW